MTSCAVARPQATDSDVYLCVVPVLIKYKGKSLRTYAFLYQGSTHTFCEQRLIYALQAEGLQSDIFLQTLNDVTREYSRVSCELVVSDLHKKVSFVSPNVFSVDKIPTEPNKVNHQALSAWPHLRDVDLKTIPGATVTLLIGANVPEMFCITNFKKDLSGGPVAIETPLCWSLLGPSLSPLFSRNYKINFVR